jgi:hypothetical protein
METERKAAQERAKAWLAADASRHIRTEHKGLWFAELSYGDSSLWGRGYETRWQAVDDAINAWEEEEATHGNA